MALSIGINSYVTIDEADEYFSGKLYTSEWDSSDTGRKEKALREACRRIERLQFKGKKASESQALAFPRLLSIKNRTGGIIGYFTSVMDGNGNPYVPLEVKHAQCEEALALLKYGNSARIKAQEQNVVRVSIGNISEEYKTGLKLFSTEAYEMLKPWLVGAVNTVI